MVGKILGNRYQIIKKIGGGGMAEVYKARCTLLNRYVAIKVLRDEFRNDREFIARFNTEAQAAASLTHPNIVSVFDVGCENGIHYIVMEFVEGVTLKEYIRRNGALPWRQALNFAVQICQAIEYAHKKGIIHRDIKPQNIMVCENNVLKVMDFGIARNLNKNGQTQDGKNAIGTVHYISPEQARGGYVDAKTDIYSIGVVLYEMMTGKLPFDHENAVSVAIMHMQQKPVPPRELVLSIPAALEEVCLKAMSKEQAQRFQTAGEMLDSLQKVLQAQGAPDPSYQSEPDSLTRKINADQIRREFSDPERGERRERRTKEKGGGGMSRTSSSKKTSGQKKSGKKGDKKPMIAAIIAAVILVGTMTCLMINWLDPGFFSSLFGGTPEDGITRIPNLVGKELDQVLEDYEDVKRVTITEEKERVPSDKYGEGVITAQSPKAGSKAGKGKIKITVTVSNEEKEEEGKMPDFSGKTLTDAKKTLSKQKLSYEVVEEYSDSVVKNGIIRQIPKAGTELDANTQIILYVSKGKEKGEDDEEDNTTFVPYLIGMSQTQAKNSLEEAGLKLGGVTVSDSEEPVGTVIGQDPGYQSQVDKKTTVSIVISSGESQATPEPTPPPVETTPTPDYSTQEPVQVTPEPQEDQPVVSQETGEAVEE